MIKEKCINASTGLFTVYTFYHSSYGHHLLAAIQPKDVDCMGQSHSEVVVADININEVTKEHAVPLSKVSNGD